MKIAERDGTLVWRQEAEFVVIVVYVINVLLDGSRGVYTEQMEKGAYVYVKNNIYHF